MIRETLRSVLLFNLKFWGMIIVIGLVVLMVGVVRAGGIHAYMKSTFSILPIFGISILLATEAILAIVLLLIREDKTAEPGVPAYRHSESGSR